MGDWLGKAVEVAKTLDRQLSALRAKSYRIGLFRPLASGQMKLQSLFTVSEPRPFTGNPALAAQLWRSNVQGYAIGVQPQPQPVASQDMTVQQREGLLHVTHLSQRQLGQLKDRGLEPACVTQDGINHYQAWVRLSEHPLKPEVAERLATGITERVGGTVTDYGLLAGFDNPGRQHGVALVASSGETASRGAELVRQAQQGLKLEQAERSREARLQTALGVPDRRTRDPMQEYRRQLHRLADRFGARLDTWKTDRLICKDMARQGYSEPQLRAVLEKASPEQPLQQARGHDHYARKTAEAAVHDPEVRRHRQKERQQERQGQKEQKEQAQTLAAQKQALHQEQQQERVRSLGKDFEIDIGL